MTMPHLHNCPHDENHICLDCSKELWDFQQDIIDKQKEEIEYLKNRVNQIYAVLCDKK